MSESKPVIYDEDDEKQAELEEPEEVPGDGGESDIEVDESDGAKIVFLDSGSALRDSIDCGEPIIAPESVKKEETIPEIEEPKKKPKPLDLKNLKKRIPCPTKSCSERIFPDKIKGRKLSKKDKEGSMYIL